MNLNQELSLILNHSGVAASDKDFVKSSLIEAIGEREENFILVKITDIKCPLSDLKIWANLEGLGANYVDVKGEVLKIFVQGYNG